MSHTNQSSEGLTSQIALVALALYQYANDVVHDEESGVITLKNWSSNVWNAKRRLRN